MELSVEVMKSSIQEKRPDEKPSPFVGAVMVRKDLSVVTAYRGELREGDHAEFTLLERKCRTEKVEGNILFATLEPCALYITMLLSELRLRQKAKKRILKQ